jgi:succinoglycan biosynthesis protein ExoM
MLSNLISKLQNQVTDNQFTYSLIVVDNDANQSARDTVTYWKQHSAIKIDYYCEPEQNIALARNKAVENSKGRFIAFIDDDEIPSDEWLFNLSETFAKHRCAGVLGPVKPNYPENTPKWLIKSKLCERASHKTGTVLKSDQTRTGNVLLDQYLFEGRNNRFNSEFGRTGGEDIEFFGRMIAGGQIFIWCEEAPVNETVPPERWRRTFYIKKYAQMGGRTGQLVRKSSLKLKCKWFAKAIISTILYSSYLPFSILGGGHLVMKCLLKDIYYINWFIGFFGRAMAMFRY